MQTLFALELFILRADRAAAEQACVRLAKTLEQRPAKSLTTQRLAMTVNGGTTFEKFPSRRLDLQHLWVFGPSLLTDDVIEPMKSDPRWKQTRSNLPTTRASGGAT